jgi:hypothetical protein
MLWVETRAPEMARTVHPLWRRTPPFPRPPIRDRRTPAGIEDPASVVSSQPSVGVRPADLR